MIKLNKSQAVNEFKELHGNTINYNDKIFIRNLWKSYINFLYKLGRISKRQFDKWELPIFCK